MSFGTTTIRGNRITEFANSAASVGNTIPFGYGKFVSPGQVIFAPMPPKEHVKKKRQGKGGTKTETYTYTLSYAIAFSKGPIYGFLWIKRNGKVVWTQDPNAPVEDAAYAAKWAQKATFYFGDKTQLPDSTIESYEGTGQVSAFRNVAFTVMEDDDVTEGGGAVPAYEACVIATPPEVYVTSHPYTISTEDIVGIYPTAIHGELTKILEEAYGEDEIGINTEARQGLLRNQYNAQYFDDQMLLGMQPVGGNLIQAIEITPIQTEELGLTYSAISGNLKHALITLKPTKDDMSLTFQPVSGALT